MSTPPLPAGITPVSTDDFTVTVRILPDPRRSLLVETKEEIEARYQDALDDLEIVMASDTKEAREAQRKRLETARKQEVRLFARLEKERGSEFQSFDFVFRSATVMDHEAAEAEANKSQPRQELSYRRVLSQKLFKTTDYPGFKDFGSLRTDLALFLFLKVVATVTLSSDVRFFLRTPGENSEEE